MTALNEKLRKRLGKKTNNNFEPVTKPIPPTIGSKIQVDLGTEPVSDEDDMEGVPKVAPICDQDLKPLYDKITKIRREVNKFQEDQECVDLLFEACRDLSKRFKIKREVLEQNLYSLQRDLFELFENKEKNRPSENSPKA